MRRNKKGKKSANHERWLLTYSDLITLLMIFFVIMYSMSNIDKEKYKKLAESLNESLGGVGTNANTEFKGNSNVEGTKTNSNNENNLSQLKEEVDKYIKENDLNDLIVAIEYKKGLVISFKDNILFNPGEDILKNKYLEILKEVGKIIQNVDTYIRVEGHTDNVKMSNEKFKSNWELSSARANSVVHFLVDNNYVSPDKISAVGYGEYRPVATNDTSEGKSKNRRVDILLIDKKYEEIEK